MKAPAKKAMDVKHLQEKLLVHNNENGCISIANMHVRFCCKLNNGFVWEAACMQAVLKLFEA